MRNRFSPLSRSLVLITVVAAGLLGVALAGSRAPAPRLAGRPLCGADNGGLALSPGFCALVVARHTGPVRHLVVAPNGDIFANLKGEGVLALRDTTGDGVADVSRRFGRGGTGIALTPGWLYVATDNAVYRYRWREGALEPDTAPETIVRDLPSHGDHTSKSIALGPAGALFVNIGSATNSCQERNRASRSPGRDPCAELETRAGVWRFVAARPGQSFRDGQRWATGLRNTVALAIDPASGALWGAVNGRDQLAQNWGFTPEKSAENPGEELVRIEEGDDFGWPYCYYDVDAKQKVLAPEYGGDGKQVGRCTRVKAPALVFPGHWAPLANTFSNGALFGPKYASGVFVAFHGSWDRSPLPQAGYRVAWVPFADGKPAGGYETFAVGARGPTSIRPSGLAIGPDGSLYVAAEDNETIWRILTTDSAGRH